VSDDLRYCSDGDGAGLAFRVLAWVCRWRKRSFGLGLERHSKILSFFPFSWRYIVGEGLGRRKEGLG